MKKIFLAGLLSLCSVFVFGQNSSLKIAYVNVDKLGENWLTFINAQDDVRGYEAKESRMVESEKRKFQEELQKAQRLTHPDSIARAERKLQYMAEDLEIQQKQASNRVQQYAVEKMQPLYDKIQSTINAVAKELGYAYVLRKQEPALQAGFLLYADNPKDDITSRVLAKLKAMP